MENRRIALFKRTHSKAVQQLAGELVICHRVFTVKAEGFRRLPKVLIFRRARLANNKRFYRHYHPSPAAIRRIAKASLMINYVSLNSPFRGGGEQVGAFIDRRLEC